MPELCRPAYLMNRETAAASAPAPGGDPAILLEDGTYILLEDGSHLLLE